MKDEDFDDDFDNSVNEKPMLWRYRGLYLRCVFITTTGCNRPVTRYNARLDEEELPENVRNIFSRIFSQWTNWILEFNAKWNLINYKVKCACIVFWRRRFIWMFKKKWNQKSRLLKDEIITLIQKSVGRIFCSSTDLKNKGDGWL